MAHHKDFQPPGVMNTQAYLPICVTQVRINQTWIHIAIPLDHPPLSVCSSYNSFVCTYPAAQSEGEKLRLQSENADNYSSTTTSWCSLIMSDGHPRHSSLVHGAEFETQQRFWCLSLKIP